MTAIQTERVQSLADSLLDLDYQTWNFGDSVAFEAMLVASEATGRADYAGVARGWFRSWANRATPFRRLDCTAPGLAMVQAARRFSDDRIMVAAIGLADYLVTRPRLGDLFLTWDHSPLMTPYGGEPLDAHAAALLEDPPPGVFVDCLHFDPPFLTALARATSRADYRQEGLRQAVGYIDALQVDSGLFEHFVLQGESSTFGPGWGRGQGWALLGLLDVVEQVTEVGLPSRDRVALDRVGAAAGRLVAAMRATQAADGHWSAVVTDSDSGVESSTAAFMAAGFRRAVDLGVVADSDRAAVEAAGRRAAAATATSIDIDGTVRNVSAAVMACTAASHYSFVPRGFRVPWGQGPALLALVAYPERS